MTDALSDLIKIFDPARVRPAINAAFDITEQDFVYQNLKQLAEGKRPDGSITARKNARYYPYAGLTVHLKEQKTGLSAVTDRVTLYDEGNYYAGVHTERKGTDLITTSKDEKAAMLEAFYGDVLGVGTEGLNDYIEEAFAPALVNELNL